MAIRRLIGRKGCPEKIYCDNGTNFHEADKELRQALKEMRKESIIAEMTYRGIECHFIPPGTPHMAGSWERLVRSVKTTLKVVLKEQAPREEVLWTLMVEAEHIVNSRPLVHVSIDPEDEEALTPNHFPIGTSCSVCLFRSFSENNLVSRKRWKIAQYLAECEWRRWLREYLPTLTRRTKWFQKDPQEVKVGDLVILVDSELPRNYWSKGRVVAVFPGSNGQIRMVDVKTKSGIFRHSVVKICVLDVAEEKNEEKKKEEIRK